MKKKSKKEPEPKLDSRALIMAGGLIGGALAGGGLSEIGLGFLSPFALLGGLALGVYLMFKIDGVDIIEKIRRGKKEEVKEDE
jgi:hypothetical protein